MMHNLILFTLCFCSILGTAYAENELSVVATAERIMQARSQRENRSPMPPEEMKTLELLIPFYGFMISKQKMESIQSLQKNYKMGMACFEMGGLAALMRTSIPKLRDKANRPEDARAFEKKVNAIVDDIQAFCEQEEVRFATYRMDSVLSGLRDLKISVSPEYKRSVEEYTRSAR